MSSFGGFGLLRIPGDLLYHGGPSKANPMVAPRRVEKVVSFRTCSLLIAWALLNPLAL